MGYQRPTKGYGVLTSPDGVVEEDTYGCRHCGKTVWVKPRQRPEDLGGLCYVCMGMLCPDCDTRKARGFACDELDRKLERAERSYEARRSYGL